MKCKEEIAVLITRVNDAFCRYENALYFFHRFPDKWRIQINIFLNFAMNRYVVGS